MYVIFKIMIYIATVCINTVYHIAGKFGRGKVWRNDSFWAFSEREFGELIDQSIGY